MSKIENLIKKLNRSPASCRYSEIERLLIYFGFEKINAKGSHIKFKHSKLACDLIIPIHGNDCKDFYKNEVKKQINKLKKI